MLGGRVSEEWKVIEQEFLGRFQKLFTRCQIKCADCRLGCVKAAAHPRTARHDCGGSHVCAGYCEYCDGSKCIGKTPTCAKEAGHEGRCECADGDHTCGQEYADVLVRSCGEECTAQSSLSRCALNVEEADIAHKSVEVRCTEKCIMDGCDEICGETNHFHGRIDIAVVAPVAHMCGNEHECQAMCEEDGICRVDVFFKQLSKTFTRARNSFQEVKSTRKKCIKKLPPGQQMHQGVHTWISDQSDDDHGIDDDKVSHYCDVRCPCYSYFCKKKFGHFGSHTTSHGSMRKTFLLSDAEGIDDTAEQGIAETCRLYCSKMGREHVHYLDCEQGSWAECVCSGSSTDQRRHCTRALEPKPEKEVDEVLHERFWQTLGWEDPCASKAQLALFGKCGFKCDALDHDYKPSYCVLPAWHKPEAKPRSGFNGFTYVSGHKLECSHALE